MRLLPGHADLDRFRTVGDPLADSVVDGFAERRIRPTDPVASLRKLADDKHPEAVALWDQVTTVPDWVDFRCMEGAFEVALQNVIPSGLSLMAGSLVESYASASGAKVLVKTGRLEHDTLKRLFETAKFASDLALHRGARPGNPAWRNVVGVRLMHAWVRRMVRARPDWDSDLWGHPVNQEDYAGTLFMFGLVYRRGLQRLGVELTPAELDGNHHNWRHVGWLMGIEPQLLTHSRDEEQALYELIRTRQYQPDDDSRLLAHSLLESMAGRPPFFLPLPVLYQISRRLIGEELADALEFPRSKVLGRALDVTRVVTRLVGTASRKAAGVTIPFGERITQGIVDYGLPEGTRFATTG